MKIRPRIYLLLMIALISCKTAVNVNVEDFGRGIPAKYKSYKFFNPKNLPLSNFSFSEENQKTIFDAVAAEMRLRGYTSVQNADLIIKVQGGTKSAREEKVDNPGGYSPYGYPYGSYGSYPYGGYGYPYRGDYDQRYRDISRKETTIIIDMIDARTDKLLWQGVATGVLGKNAGEVDAKIRETISRVFQEFPYQAGKGR